MVTCSAGLIRCHNLLLFSAHDSRRTFGHLLVIRPFMVFFWFCPWRFLHLRLRCLERHTLIPALCLLPNDLEVRVFLYSAEARMNWSFPLGFVPLLSLLKKYDDTSFRLLSLVIHMPPTSTHICLLSHSFIPIPTPQQAQS